MVIQITNKKQCDKFFAFMYFPLANAVVRIELVTWFLLYFIEPRSLLILFYRAYMCMLSLMCECMILNRYNCRKFKCYVNSKPEIFATVAFKL